MDIASQRVFSYYLIMRYEKEPLSYDQLADLLLNRGLDADREDLVKTLERISYYRFTGYLFPFRIDNSDNYTEGTSLEKVLRVYQFDEKLRFILFSTVNHVEVWLRNRIMHAHTSVYGAQGYLNYDNLSKLSKNSHVNLITCVLRNYMKRKDSFLKHFKETYGLFDDFPLWMAFELFTFGDVIRVYQGMTNKEKLDLFRDLDIPRDTMESWLLSINYLRNLCAHHNRLWNRRLARSPKKLSEKNIKYSQWYSPVKVFEDSSNHKIFSVMSILQYFSKTVMKDAGFVFALNSLLEEYPEIEISQMGFPENWLECPIWLE